MDFSGIAKDTGTGVTASIDYVLSLGISPAEKIARITLIIRTVGIYFHSKLYDDVSYALGSSIIASAGFDDANAQAERLATKTVRNYALSRSSSALIKEYYDSLLGRAQDEAFNNALSLQKHPTLTRSIVGETCTWCDSKAGTFTNPSPEHFARHDRCDCLIVASGFNTRNGIVTNYVKKRG